MAKKKGEGCACGLSCGMSSGDREIKNVEIKEKKKTTTHVVSLRGKGWDVVRKVRNNTKQNF